MKWDADYVSREKPDFELMATYKYNHYQNFFPGMRYIESLAYWLDQFGSDQEKRVAYEYINRKLIYISDDEIEHLISVVYPDYIKNILIDLTSVELNIPKWQVSKIIHSKQFKIISRQSMFLGLSDGANIGLFRRSNPELSHEQILRSHEITPERASDMLSILDVDIQKILDKPLEYEDKLFKNVFLLDDFSGSGISYLRYDEIEKEYKGKIANFYNEACTQEGHINHLFSPKKMNVCLILYVATEKALRYISKEGERMFYHTPFSVKVIHLIPDSAIISEKEDADFIGLMEKYYDSDIETKSYLKGKHDKPWFGFDECGIPLILNHNTPNNSIPLIWFGKDHSHRGLFPRVNRHSE
jgi:hypothetical protein